ncbi:MAG: polyprenyl synthetase family protein [Proteobacteria bacterium]|nr:polyprenyl synthetase family protein [Pseudomonadota bacterium]
MNIFDLMRQSKSLILHGGQVLDALGLLEEELSEALSLYWTTAQAILRGSGITLLEKPADFLKLENNFFSALFLYSYHRAGIPRGRRVLYAALNHCLRGMVTGCDNILDDEYKKTLETDLPAGATRFRSIIDIMASDRALFSILMEAYAKNELSSEQVLMASTASLHALTASGIQESTEEQGIQSILTPQDILSKVHHYKTGLLFNCPWGIPAVLENLSTDTVAPLQQALYRIGIGCQILDDMVDLGRDAREARHNYAASLIYHGSVKDHWRQLQEKAAAEPGDQAKATLLLDFPPALEESAHVAQRYLIEGLTALFDEQHQFAVEPALAFLYRRIGTEHLMAAAGRPA